MTAPCARTIVCDAGELSPDVGTVGALARLQLGARRCGAEIRLLEASTELQELIELVGLSDVLRVEPGRESE
jgi:ABC-type transporter Mla MlaB component